ncbi:FkbM family methyltransferase [Bradyrhizobium sp. 193]|uniref:FkbM family methyltransferase n=1 Tax=Bradyrhizobium sp. 193 TaxID=2782661 RepID=UPI001FF89803|nr:FkbM family methyltransferase [Bradyrhizobium sp. 193]MCK1485642.1 FkbM family methyltransferase [Bradyrhizobium sp. 193]
MSDKSVVSRAKLHILDRWFRYVTVPSYLAKIRPSDVVIDCGANVGKFAELFAARGAMVYAFEPHPIAFSALHRRIGGLENVRCINKAVSDRAGRMKLYLRPNDNSIAATESSSLMAEKINVSTSHFVEVDVVRLVDFIREVGRIRFLKMDIEGAEYDVLPDMLNANAHREVDYIVVETHERSPDLLPSHVALVERIRKERVENIDLNWH